MQTAQWTNQNSKANTRNRRQARENACDQDMIGFGFTSYWLRKWREFYQPITERSDAKPKQKRNYFRHSLYLIDCNYLIPTPRRCKGQDTSSVKFETHTSGSWGKEIQTNDQATMVVHLMYLIQIKFIYHRMHCYGMYYSKEMLLSCSNGL